MKGGTNGFTTTDSSGFESGVFPGNSSRCASRSEAHARQSLNVLG